MARWSALMMMVIVAAAATDAAPVNCSTLRRAVTADGIVTGDVLPDGCFEQDSLSSRMTDEEENARPSSQVQFRFEEPLPDLALLQGLRTAGSGGGDKVQDPTAAIRASNLVTAGETGAMAAAAATSGESRAFGTMASLIAAGMQGDHPENASVRQTGTPEPSTYLLIAAGLGAFALVRRLRS